MRRIIFATGNMGKMREIRMIFADTDVEVLSMKEAGVETDIVENGDTFEENALIKARAIATVIQEMNTWKKINEKKLEESQGVENGKFIIMADDSGLEVDYLNKEPGVYSARYMGEDTSYHIKNKNLVDRLTGVETDKRTARFVCAIAAVLPDGTEMVTKASIEGRIGYEEAGENGFGYDPIFYLPEYGCTTAELEPDIKNRLSHRGKALEKMKKELLHIL